MGGGRAKALADRRRGTGALQAPKEKRCPPEPGVLPPRGRAPRTRGATGAAEGCPGQAAWVWHSGRKKRGRSYPWAGNEAVWGRRVKAKGAGRGSEATRRAGLPGRGGTRRASAAGPGEQRTPTRGRRAQTSPRGAGNAGRPRPRALCPAAVRTGPAPRRLPPASLPSLSPAARYPAVAALTSGCT